MLKVNLSWTRKKVKFKWCKKVLSLQISFYVALKAKFRYSS